MTSAIQTKTDRREEQLVQDIIRQAANTNEFLEHLPNKAPTQCLNDVIAEFHKVVYPFYDDCLIHTVMNDTLINDNLVNLRSKLSECEFELEIYWAHEIAQGRAHYTQYPYMERYHALLQSEQNHLCNIVHPESQAFCFIGSGPMPISAFELKRSYPNVTMHGVEMDADAIALAQQVSARSGVDVHYTQSLAEEADFAQFDVIFVASMTINKKAVLAQIAKTAKNGTIIAVRSVERLRYMLYEPVAAEMIPHNFASLGRTPYSEKHVNTTLFYRLQK